MKTIYRKGNYRIIEVIDDYFDIEHLKGDSFNPEINKDIDSEILKKQELDFERKAELEGIYGYELQLWNPEIDCGWEFVDSCWGFVGQYDETNNPHYIVDELKLQIK